MLLEGAAKRAKREQCHFDDANPHCYSTEHRVAAQDTAYVTPCFSEDKRCGVPNYLGVDNVDETWCNCDLDNVCPVSRAPYLRAAPI